MTPPVSRHDSPASHLRDPEDLVKIRIPTKNSSGLAFPYIRWNKLAALDVTLFNRALGVTASLRLGYDSDPHAEEMRLS